jgi:hypothetical protein
MNTYDLASKLAALLRTPEDDARELIVTEREAITRFCALMGKVRERLGGPADCFCPGSYRDPTGYRNDGKAIEYIEAATLAALAAELKAAD